MKESKLSLGSGRWFTVSIALACVLLGFTSGLIVFSTASSGSAASEGALQVTAGQPGQSFRGAVQSVLPVIVEIEIINQGESSANFPDPGMGSGVIVKKNSDYTYVLTNNHVVQDAEEIRITLYNGKKYKARLIGEDVRKDLALLTFDAVRSVPAAVLGDSSKLQVGDWVLAVGNPFGLESTVTAGIISALGRRGGPGGNISDFIQTDAAISPGNSGGALVNTNGEVVGINTWIASNTGGNIGYGFAIPINTVKRAIPDLISHGRVEYAWLGVQIVTPEDKVAQELSLQNESGALVAQVFLNSPADIGGIHLGDFIVKLNGSPVRNSEELTHLLGDQIPREAAEFEILRMGAGLVRSIPLGTRPTDGQILSGRGNLWPGMSVRPLSANDRISLDLKEESGVSIYNIIEGSPAGSAGFRPEDVIYRINSQEITNLADFYRALNAENSKEYLFRIGREGSELKIILPR